MSSPVVVAPAQPDDREAVRRVAVVDHSFLPDFAWSAVGGVVTLAVCALLFVLAFSWHGGPPIWSYPREMTGVFLAGFLAVLVARTLTARSA
jgi:hypothetical protein